MKEWADKLRAEAERLIDLWHRCPHCDSKLYECALCEPLWHLAELLRAYAATAEKVAAAAREAAR